MKDKLKEIEIPFGAKDSELCGWEYTIPEGMEATIVDNKIIVKKKESEDEKTRKEIINYLKQRLKMDSSIPAAIGYWIYWLEKQGKQTIEEFARKVTHDKEYAIAFLKSAGIMNEDGQLAEEYRTEADTDKSEQNPAWSEEDESLCDYLLGELNASLKDYCGAALKDMEKAIDWFKSLKDRVQPQNLNITDEELIKARNEAYNDALDKLEYHSDTPTFSDGWSAAIWYLKKRNAQPQNTWKPSDAQMEYLSAAIEESNENPVLESLYKDLKKLKE